MINLRYHAEERVLEVDMNAGLALGIANGIAEVYEKLLQARRRIETADKTAGRASRFVDVSLDSLTTNPVSTITKCYRKLGLTMTDA